MSYEFRTIEYRWLVEPDGETYTADVVVGDGTVEYDKTFDAYDERVFFYFKDEKEFAKAREGKLKGMEFAIVGVEV